MDIFSGPPAEEEMCSHPPRPVNGSIVGKVRDQYESGAMILYRCRNGLTLVGSPNATCHNGQWMPLLPPTCDGNI